MDFRLRGSRIDLAFAHDDGIGPYAPIDLTQGDKYIETRWPNPDRSRKLAQRLELLVPLGRLIRLRFHDMLSAVAHFDNLMKQTDRSLGLRIFAKFEWDITLTTPRQLKSEIASAAFFSDADRSDLVAADFPHFMWRVDAYEASEQQAILLFDATELRQGAHIIRICYTNNESANIFSAYAEGFRKLWLLKCPHITKSILRHLINPVDDAQH